MFPDPVNQMKIGVCGIACQACPRRVSGRCPHGEDGCTAQENRMCQIATCAFRKGMALCFLCPQFPCETTKLGPVSYGYCQFISGKDA
jgi:hypothetical protein